MKYLCFRFDVDTHKCLEEGVPNIIRLGRKYGAKFTFFVNCGRAIDRRSQLRGLFSNNKKDKVVMLSALEKLGAKEFLYLTFFNPVISQNQKKIKLIYSEGHEVGLHGGTNHESWQKNAKRWKKEAVYKEILWGLERLKDINPSGKIDGFSSPAWATPKNLLSILNQLGFKYFADRHSDKGYQLIKKRDGVADVPTTIVGEPGGVGYVEHCVAKKMSDREIIEDFRKKLSTGQKIAVVYDHPYFIGVQKKELLEQLIKTGKKCGYSIRPLGELI